MKGTKEAIEDYLLKEDYRDYEGGLLRNALEAITLEEAKMEAVMDCLEWDVRVKASLAIGEVILKGRNNRGTK